MSESVKNGDTERRTRVFDPLSGALSPASSAPQTVRSFPYRGLTASKDLGVVTLQRGGKVVWTASGKDLLGERSDWMLWGGVPVDSWPFVLMAAPGSYADSKLTVDLSKGSVGALDRESGAILWSKRGTLPCQFSAGGGSTVALCEFSAGKRTYDSSGGTARTTKGAVGDLVGVDVQTGAEKWRISIDPDNFASSTQGDADLYDADPSRRVVRIDGQVAVVDIETGKVTTLGAGDRMACGTERGDVKVGGTTVSTDGSFVAPCGPDAKATDGPFTALGVLMAGVGTKHGIVVPVGTGLAGYALPAEDGTTLRYAR